MKTQVKYRNFAFYRLLFSLKFVGNVFVSFSYDLASASIISSHVITELSEHLLNIYHFGNCKQQDSKYHLLQIYNVFTLISTTFIVILLLI